MKNIKRLLAIVLCLVIIAGIGVAVYLYTAGKPVSDTGMLDIYYVDVGQADCAILRCGGKVMMIDGGNSDDSRLIYSFLKNTLGIDHIDMIIATHPHEDHIGGLSAALNACSVGIVYSPVSEAEGKEFSSLKKYTEAQGLELTYPPVGKSIDFGDADVLFLAPLNEYDDVNDLSIVVKVIYKNTSFLFTGDAEYDSEQDMIASGEDLSADVLKVGHHGSDSSTSYAFLEAVDPDYAVISVGEGNSYGHPTEEVLSRLSGAGAVIYRTDELGTIHCVSNGTDISFSSEKESSGSRSVTLDTSSGNDSKEISTSADAESAEYIGNSNSHKFHLPKCESVSDMKEKNKVYFSDRESAVNAGYSPCARCQP